MNAVRAIVVLAISALFLFLLGPPMFENPPSLYTGLTLRGTIEIAGNPQAIANGPSSITVAPHSPAHRAGLRSGDVVSCLSQQTVMILASSHAPYTSTPLTLCVRRGSSWRPVSITAVRMPPSGYVYVSFPLAALRLAVYVIFLIVGCALVMARPSVMTWLLFGYCVLNAPTSAAIAMDVGGPLGVMSGLFLISALESTAAPGFLALFALVVPENLAPRGWRRATFYALAAITLVVVGIPSLSILRGALLYNPGSLADSVLTAFTVLIVIARFATMERRERARFGWAAFAIIFGVVVNALRTGFIQSGSGLANLVSFSSAYLTVVMPIALMYAILRRHVIDVRFVISRGVVYAAITTFVVGLIGIVDWATSVYLHEARAAMAVEAAVIIALGFVLHRAYRWIEYAVDFVLFRQKHEADAYLGRLARTLPFAQSEESVDRAVVRAPYEKLALSGVALFRSRTQGFAVTCVEGWHSSEVPPLPYDHALPRFFMAERGRVAVADLDADIRASLPESCAAAVAIPIFQRNDLTGFALYGLHRDGTRLDPDEERVLEHLCEAAAQAYTGVELDEYRGARTVPRAVEAGSS